MKKTILTIGLFTLVLVSTSFASPKDSISTITDPNITSTDGTGSQSTGGNRKVDYNGRTFQSQNTGVDGTGSQSTGGNRKVD